MAFNWRTPGIVWLEHAGENAAIAAATAGMSVLTGSATKTLQDVSWAAVLSSAGFAAVYALLLAVMSLRGGNGTASFLPRVVAGPPKRWQHRTVRKPSAAAPHPEAAIRAKKHDSP